MDVSLPGDRAALHAMDVGVRGCMRLGMRLLRPAIHRPGPASLTSSSSPPPPRYRHRCAAAVDPDREHLGPAIGGPDPDRVTRGPGAADRDLRRQH
jgi:hypothetical protein